MTWKDYLLWAALRIMFLCIYVLVGLVFAAFGRPLMRRKIGPNGVYGYRVGKTLSDPKVWYDANRILRAVFLLVRSHSCPLRNRPVLHSRA
jgi:uncharacterized membrane protein